MFKYFWVSEGTIWNCWSSEKSSISRFFRPVQVSGTGLTPNPKNWKFGTQVTIEATVVTIDMTTGAVIPPKLKGFELKKNRALFCCCCPKEPMILDW